MTIILFDVDGTLTPAGDRIQPEMVNAINILYSLDYQLGIVGGGTYDKIKWQLGESFVYFTYIFAECGALVYVNGVLTKEKNMLEYCDRSILNSLIKVSMIEIANMPIIHHGNPIDFRKGLIYISPPGNQATRYERQIFMNEDFKFRLRENLLEKLKKMDNTNQFDISIGGNVGIAICPRGWDKSQILSYFDTKEEIYYFGDKTEPGGNDYPIFSHPRVIGVSVNNFYNTISQIEKKFINF